MKKFEYQILYPQTNFVWGGEIINDCEAWLNAIGLDGWELTAVYRMKFFFKRELI